MKRKSEIILGIWLITTILNKWIVGYDDQWTIAMISIALTLVVFAYDSFKRSKRIIDLTLLLVFISEFFAVCFGWSLQTDYYTEFILMIIFGGIFLIIKKWLRP